MTTLLFLLLCILVLQSLGRPSTGPRGVAVSWSEVASRLVDDVRSGVRALSRLDAARRERLGRPWS